MFKIRLNIATTFYAWNTDIFQRTPAAMLTGGGHRYLPALIYPMHLRGALFHNVTQPRSDFHTNPMTDLAIEESAVGYIDGIHLFKAHGLSGKLHLIHLICLWLSMLIFHGQRSPTSGISGMLNGISDAVGRQKLYGITDTVKTKLAGGDTDGTQGYMLTALLTIKRIIHMLVQQLAFNRKPIVFPLLLKMNESPLPGTEPEVLYPRQHQHIVVRIHTQYYISSSTVTFAGTASLSIVTL